MARTRVENLLEELSQRCGKHFELRKGARNQFEIWMGPFPYQILERFADVRELRTYIQGMLAGFYECRR